MMGINRVLEDLCKRDTEEDGVCSLPGGNVV